MIEIERLRECMTELEADRDANEIERLRSTLRNVAEMLRNVSYDGKTGTLPGYVEDTVVAALVLCEEKTP